MEQLFLPKQFRTLFIVRMTLEIIFLIYLVFQQTPFETFLLFFVAIVAAEGYKFIGCLGIDAAPRNRDMIGIVTGALNGVIFMITIFLTGYAGSEFWILVFISLVITGYDYGMYGILTEAIVMSAMYVFVGSLEGLPVMILLLRSLAFSFVAVMFGEKARKEFTLEKRFSEMEKKKNLTKEERVRFIAVVSHSLRTPITTVAGYVDLLKKGRVGKMTKAQEEIVNKLSNETEEMSGLIKNFLSITVFEEKGVDVELKEFDIGDLCDEIYKETKPWTVRKGIEYVYKKKLDHCPYIGDRSRLENAIKNVIDNAMKFTPSGGRVSFLLAHDVENYIIEIKDTGIGIPKEDQKDVFSMFKRGTNVLKYEYAGIGIGLYTSRMIVEALGGRIELVSEEGRGSTFSIVLPTGKLAEVVRKLGK